MGVSPSLPQYSQLTVRYLPQRGQCTHWLNQQMVNPPSQGGGFNIKAGADQGGAEPPLRELSHCLTSGYQLQLTVCASGAFVVWLLPTHHGNTLRWIHFGVFTKRRWVHYCATLLWLHYGGTLQWYTTVVHFGVTLRWYTMVLHYGDTLRCDTTVWHCGVTLRRTIHSGGYTTVVHYGVRYGRCPTVGTLLWVHYGGYTAVVTH